MKVADLFVNIGVKGSGETAKGLTEVKAGLDEVYSSGLAAKALMASVLYGIGALTKHAGDEGMNLKKFANYTGLSTDALQRWQ